MKTYVAGTSVTLSVTFTRNEQPAIPNAGSSSWALLDNRGVEIANGVLEMGPTDFTALVEIPAELNLITTTFSKRTLVARALHGTSPIEFRETYRLLPAINYTVRPAEVRAYFGVKDHELPDEDIDIAKAFLEIQGEVGKLELAAALSSGEDAELKANDAILYKVALNTIPSLANRVANKESDGQLSFQRNTQRDFSALAAITAERLASALTLVATRTLIGYSLLITTNDADPVTG